MNFLNDLWRRANIFQRGSGAGTRYQSPDVLSRIEEEKKRAQEAFDAGASRQAQYEVDSGTTSLINNPSYAGNSALPGTAVPSMQMFSNPLSGFAPQAGGMQNPAGGMQNPVGGMQNPVGGLPGQAGGADAFNARVNALKQQNAGALKQKQEQPQVMSGRPPIAPPVQQQQPPLGMPVAPENQEDWEKKKNQPVVQGPQLPKPGFRTGKPQAGPNSGDPNRRLFQSHWQQGVRRPV